MAWCQTCTIKPGGWNCAKSWHHLLLHAARGRTLWSDKSCAGTGLRTGMQENTPLSHTHTLTTTAATVKWHDGLLQCKSHFQMFIAYIITSSQQAAWFEVSLMPIAQTVWIMCLSFILRGLFKCLTKATVKLIVNTTNYSLMVIICIPFNKAILFTDVNNDWGRCAFPQRTSLSHYGVFTKMLIGVLMILAVKLYKRKYLSGPICVRVCFLH